jgi:hypothetical protein
VLRLQVCALPVSSSVHSALDTYSALQIQNPSLKDTEHYIMENLHVKEHGFWLVPVEVTQVENDWVEQW